MKIVVFGGSGLIGSRLVDILRHRGAQVRPASPSLGVNAYTGQGLADMLADADVVVDVMNSPSFEEKAVLDFFKTTSRNIINAEEAAGVKHHVALSVVGTDRMKDIGYFRAKYAQETLVRESMIPHTILRATQFYEFIESIARTGGEGETIRLTPAKMQPIAAADVSQALADVAMARPRNGILEIGGPERMGIDYAARRYFAYQEKTPLIITDPKAGYFGAMIDDQSLTTSQGAMIAATTFEEWLTRHGAPAH